MSLCYNYERQCLLAVNIIRKIDYDYTIVVTKIDMNIRKYFMNSNNDMRIKVNS